MDLRSEMKASYRCAYEDNPGLEKFHRRKMWLLWGVFGLAAVQKFMAVLFFYQRSLFPALIMGLIGLGIPGILVLAVYRGPWKFSLILYALAGISAVDLIKNGAPILATGNIQTLPVYLIMAAEAVYLIYVLAVAVWLTIPARNRTYTQILNGIFREYGEKMKEIGRNRQV